VRTKAPFSISAPALALLLTAGSWGCTAQEAPPSTDLFLVDWSAEDGRFRTGVPRNITDRDGYDNQPAFLPDGRALYYSSIGADGQTEIHRYDVPAGNSRQLTRTLEEEYSPTPLPRGDGFSVVRVEQDGRQRLWQFHADGSEDRPILPEIEAVGYHAWVGADTLALFILGDEESPATLQLASPSRGTSRVVAGEVGRCIERVPGRRAVSFVDQTDPESWWIKEVDVDTDVVRPLIRTRAGCEDYAWTADGAILMPCGSDLYRWLPGSDDGWVQVAALGEFGLVGLTRIDVSPEGNLLALVAARGGG
jgi:hypothetical protein